VAAKIAHSIGAVTIAVVTMPFSFEMGRRQQNASNGIKRLRPNTDTLIAIPNDRLLYVAPRDLPLDTAFRLADDVLRQAVQGITELITTPGMINVDFANVRNLMKLGGGALMSIGQGEGDGQCRWYSCEFYLRKRIVINRSRDSTFTSTGTSRWQS
jgi:cell division protein FtsZ